MAFRPDHLLLATLGALLSMLLSGIAAERPNIVLIMADDLGFADLGCYGGEIETPNLDSLARNGLRFTQFYNTAKCHSSRVDLLTGLYCSQAGDESMSRGITIAEALRPAGYFTAMSGKWHLKKEPTDRGFDRYFGHLSGSTNFFTGDDTFRLNGEKFEVPQDGSFYTTDAKTDYGIRFIDEALPTKKPFFLYMAYNAPHYPLHAPKEDVMKYRGKYRGGWDKLRTKRYQRQLDLGLISPAWKLSPRPDDVAAWDSLDAEKQDWEDFRMAAYAAMVDRLDRQIGRLITHLKAKGIFDQTLIMFCSDNGACPFERTKGKDKMPWNPESYWTYDTGWAHAGNTPFRWYKQNQHEGGISSPMIAHWPAGLKAKAGSLTDQPGHLIDFMATALDLAGADYPKAFAGRALEPLQGKSLVPIFEGKQRQPHDWLYFHFNNNRAIRQGDWKLTSARGGAWELYNLKTDRTELNDLAASKPEKTTELKALWHRVATDVDKLPEKKRRPVGNKNRKKNVKKGA
ncbi:MAG: arylsulfatase A-like enzyme [Verrucomicrobiales bacterium]|jgi:arylsulfatase A-like enzyme